MSVTYHDDAPLDESYAYRWRWICMDWNSPAAKRIRKRTNRPRYVHLKQDRPEKWLLWCNGFARRSRSLLLISEMAQRARSSCDAYLSRVRRISSSHPQSGTHDYRALQDHYGGSSSQSTPQMQSLQPLSTSFFDNSSGTCVPFVNYPNRSFS